MLTLTKKTHYALIAMTYLAEHPEEFCSARQVAEKYSLPLPVLMNILKSLNQRGLVDSTRGAKGGYRLAVAPAEISLAQLIGAVEGPVRFVHCVENHNHTAACELSECCPIRGPVLRVGQRLLRFLNTVMLDELTGTAAPADAEPADAEPAATER